MKKLMAMLLAASMTLSLAACGGNSDSSDNGNNNASNGGSESGYTTDSLLVNIWDSNQLDGLQKIADKWTEKSGVKVKIEVISWDSYWTLLEAGASGGELPDVFWMHINEAQKYMEANVLLDLNDYIANDASIDMNNYYEGIVDLYNLDGHQFALPKDHDTIAMIYNKTIFDKYGIAYPDDTWDWNKYAEVAAQISEAGKGEDIYGTAMNTNDGQDGWYDIIYGFGGKLISDDNKKSGMDDENTIKAMTWLADNLFPSMPAQSLMAETDPDLLFMNDMVGMMLQGSWMVNTFYQHENSANYGWAQIPYYDANSNGACDEGERVSMYNGLGWAASAKTKDAKAAYDLMAYFASEEGQLMQSELGVTMAAYKGASDAFTSAFEGMDLTPFIEVEKSGTLIQHPSSKYTTRWESGFTTGLLPAWEHPETMADVCRDMAVMMNEVLAEE